MGKSILVIDTPESCVKCSLKNQIYDIHYICSGNHKRMTIPGNVKKPDWCPLVDLPDKYKIVSMNDERENNTCINELLRKN